MEQAIVDGVDAEPTGDRRWVWAIVVGYCLVFVVLATTGPPGAPRQPIQIPRGDDAFEIVLQDRFIDDGTVARAWAVDPRDILGSDLGPSRDLVGDHIADPLVFRNVGGYDALVVYSVYPSCGWAPEIRAVDRFESLRIEVRSRGGCTADSIRVVRGVAVEFAAEFSAATVTATHRDP